MRGLSSLFRRISKGVAYYPTTFYLGLATLVAVGVVAWLHYHFAWSFDFQQLKMWVGNHLVDLSLVFGFLLSLTLIGSAICYRQLINLPQDDYWLWLNQQATRTLFPWMLPFHDWLRLKVRIYRWWHTRHFASGVHFIILVLALAGAVNFTLNNISPAQASHGCVDAVSITGNTTWATNQCHGNVTVTNGATLTINGGVTTDLTSLTLGDGVTNGFITAKGDTLNNLGVVINADGNVDIKTGSSISADGQGYLGGAVGNHAGAGPGGGASNGTSDAAGAAYGGYGGDGAGSLVSAAPYGSMTAPTDLGSGGGGSNSNAAGNGGGAIKINAPSGTVTVNGTITAGGASSGCCAAPGAGGGSGGSIWVISNALAGSGTVRANGGVGLGGSTPGDGAGGRVQLTFNSDTSALTKQATGGNNVHKAAAGTFSTSTDLLIVNASASSVPATSVNGTATYNTFTVKDGTQALIADSANINGGTTLIQNGATVALAGNNAVWSGGALTVQTGTNTINIPVGVVTEPTFSSINIGTGTLTHAAHTTVHTYSIILKSTGDVTVSGTINLDGKGYAGGTTGSDNGKGPGGGTGGINSGGGAHGGNGGTGGFAGGTAYDAIDAPVDLGSGGGGTTSSSYNNGGAGGGAVKLTSGGTMTVSGTITAYGLNGGTNCCNYAGGGAGGSIWLSTSTLAGAGTVRATGGYSGSSGAAGDGAGGRIRLTYTTDSSTLTKQAYAAGTSTKRGGAGTISTSGGLTIGNDPASTTASTVTPLSDSSYSYTSLTIKDAANVSVGSSTTLSGGSTLLSNNVRLTLGGNSTVWSGTGLTTQTGTNTINVPYAISAEPLFSSINIASGTVNHDSHTTTHVYSVILKATGNVTVAGTINLDGLGYAGGTSGSGTGKGPGGGADGAGNNAGGAAHGGNGGAGAVAGGTAYDSFTAPSDLGSGGGGTSASSYNNGGAGGGAVKLTSGATMTVSGTITAYGLNGVANCCVYAGGGSGGSIWLITDTLSGSGTVRATGGYSGSAGAAGDGAGGRIQLTFNTDNSTLTEQAFAAGTTVKRGGAGTISTSSKLIIANDSASTTASAATPISGTVSYPATDIKDAAQLLINSGATFAGGTTLVQNNAKVLLGGNSAVWSGGALTVQTGTNTIDIPPAVTTKPLFSSITVGTGTLIHDTNATAHSYSIILKATGNIDVTGTISTDGRGYSGSFGTSVAGLGPGGGPGSDYRGGGGSYGGVGGPNSAGTSSSTYGSALNPTDIGSGGGGGPSSTGGTGGGAIELDSSGTLTVSGTVTSNGSNGTGFCCGAGGGGSGGSVWLTATTLAGAGTITANGGAVTGDAGGACGSGGRIGRHYQTNSFGGTLTANKGAGCANGNNGTTQTVGTVTHYTVSGITSPITAGTTASATIAALDASNNRNYAYSGTATFSSSDGQATLPSNRVFTVADEGQATVSGVVLKTAGTQSVTVTDTVTGSITGSQSSITVNAAALSQLRVTGIGVSQQAGTLSSPVIAASDAYSNTITSYTGTIHITSTDSQAVLPGDYTFVGSDNGTHTFTNGVQLKTVGTQSVTATDSGNSISGSQSGISVTPGGAATLTLSGVASPITAGTQSTVTVRAKDLYNNTATGFTGTITFTSTDSQAVLPGNYTFVGGDSGTHVFTNGVTLKTSGSQSVTATDVIAPSITGSQSSITVDPAATSALSLSGITDPVTAGTATTAVTRALDTYGNVTPSYVGTVHFTSTDPSAILPGNYTFVGGDNGVRTFTNGVTLVTAGSRSVTVTDTVTGSITGTQSNIDVNPGAATSFIVSGIASPIVAGTSSNLTVIVKDNYSNVVGGYTGTVTFSSNDPQAVLPADYSFTGADAGSHTFTSGVTLKTAGSIGVSATDTVSPSLTGQQAGISVEAAPASSLVITGLTTAQIAGTVSSPDVTAKDQFDNTATGYTGKVHFTSSDNQADLPADYTFTGIDAGTHHFTNGVTLKTAGTQSVTVTDTAAGSVTGSVTGIAINHAATSTLRFAESSLSVTAGTAISFGLTAKDAFNNTDTTYAGTVRFTSTDPAATLPADYLFTASDGGSHIFTNSATFKTVGTQTLTATDTANSVVTGQLPGIIVAAAPTTGGGSGGTEPPPASGGGQATQIIPITVDVVNETTGQFTGHIDRDVDGERLTVSLAGTLAGASLAGTISGKYGQISVKGIITAAVKDDKITSGTISLFAPADVTFSHQVLIKGVVKHNGGQSGQSGGRPKPCQLVGDFVTTINGQTFTGTVQFKINPDGSLSGTAKGLINGQRTIAKFTATSFQNQIISGDLVIINNTSGNKTQTGHITGHIQSGDIVLTSGNNCSIKPIIIFTPPGGGTGSGTAPVILPDQPPIPIPTPTPTPIIETPVPAPTPKPISPTPNPLPGVPGPIEAPVSGIVTTNPAAPTDVLVDGVVSAPIDAIIIRPVNPTFTAVKTDDAASTALVIVGAASTALLFPAIQAQVLSSSARGVSLWRWFFIGYLPKRKRKKWGVVKDALSLVPLAGILVRLIEVASGQEARRLRTDKTGQYGFIVDQPGQYRVEITDPLYRSYQSGQLAVTNPANLVINQDILLQPLSEERVRIEQRGAQLLTALKALTLLHWPVLIGGSIFALLLVIQQPTPLRVVVLAFYVVLWPSSLLGLFRRRPYGVVYGRNGQPAAQAVVELTGKVDGVSNHIFSTFTDKFGRFVLLVKPGQYDLTVAKEGYRIKQQAISADELGLTVKLEAS